MTIDLPPEAWRVLHALLMEDQVPRRAALAAVAAFERALQAAQEPQPDVPA